MIGEAEVWREIVAQGVGEGCARRDGLAEGLGWREDARRSWDVVAELLCPVSGLSLAARSRHGSRVWQWRIAERLQQQTIRLS